MARTYDDSTKAAVMAALLQGQSISSVAKEYDIPKGTVSSWNQRAQGGVAADSTQKKEIGELLLEYLKANLYALRVQAEQFANTKWLNKQQADQVAVLHGVMTDKAIRLLEAFSTSDSDTDTED